MGRPEDDSITHYKILRRNRATQDPGQFNVLEENTGSGAVSYTDGTVEPEIRYVYRVKAVNINGESRQSSYTRADTPAAPVPPAAPTGLTAGSVTHESVTLTWDDPDDDSITGYRVLRRERSDGTELEAIEEDTGSADNTYTDDTVEPERPYEYRIIAINDDGLSGESNSANADTLPPPMPAGSSQDVLKEEGKGSRSGNPWGCAGRSDHPHESTRSPGLGYVQAKAHIVCDQTPPSGHTEEIFQDLSVWDGSWVTIAQNTSNCPSGTGSPSCYPNSTAPYNMMTAYVNEPCEVGSRKTLLAVSNLHIDCWGEQLLRRYLQPESG